ncbi:MAG TPA: DUF2335 domain-containing protein [Terracidiphilus sp.]|nr:DUF2335 domain-containing protein [Terracidiphilus sp.]
MSGKRYKKRPFLPSGQGGASPVQSNSASIQAKVQTEFFSGPVPPPSLLARYNEVVPDGAERILAMAERQSKHREILEAQVVAANIDSQRWGSRYAFVLALLAIAGGIFLIYSGRNTSGLATVITALVGLVSVFFYTQNQQRKERVEKSNALAERRRQ